MTFLAFTMVMQSFSMYFWEPEKVHGSALRQQTPIVAKNLYA